MGQSIEAHVGFGWPLNEEVCAWAPGHESCTFDTEFEFWECSLGEDQEDLDLFDVFDEHPVLELGYDGSLYSSTGRVLILRGSEVSTDWKAKPLVLPDLSPLIAEVALRKAATELGIRLPAEPPTWLLWPLEG